MSEELKPRCAKCQGWRQTKNEEAVTLVNGTALCAWHAKEGERDELSRLRAENTDLKRRDREQDQRWEAMKSRAEAAAAKVASLEGQKDAYIKIISDLEAKVLSLTKERDECGKLAAEYAVRKEKEIAALTERVKAYEVVVGAARYIGTEHSGMCATVACNCVGLAKRRAELAAALSRLAAPEKECRDCVDPTTGKCEEHPAPEKKLDLMDCPANDETKDAPKEKTK